jgi:hypothetical protein
MINNETTRRRFLVAAIAFSGIASTTLGPSALRISAAWAESRSKPDDETMRAMVRMARLLYPHDGISDEVYAGILNGALLNTASDETFADALDRALEALNTARAADWTALDKREQIAVLKEVEVGGFFAAIQGTVRAGIYLNPVFWDYIGYPGSSKEFGGYLNRGSGDIDWLPED